MHPDQVPAPARHAMPNLNDICREMVETVDHALAAAVVDQESGLLLGVAHHVSWFTQSLLDTLAAATVDLFRGKAVATVEKMLGQAKGETIRHSLHEMQFATGGVFHFISAVPDRPDLLVVLVTTRAVNLGMGWAGLRSRLKDVAATAPGG